MATLAGLSETGNAYSITITDTSVDAAALNTLDGKTTVAIDASNITTLTGAAADLNTAYTSNDITISGATKTSPSPTPRSTSPPSTPSMATPQAPSMPAPSTPSPVLPQTSTALTPPNGITGLDDEDVTLSDTTLDVPSSTPSMATPQAPSMPATSPPSPVPLLISIPPTPPTTTAPSQA